MDNPGHKGWSGGCCESRDVSLAGYYHFYRPLGIPPPSPHNPPLITGLRVTEGEISFGSHLSIFSPRKERRFSRSAGASFQLTPQGINPTPPPPTSQRCWRRCPRRPDTKRQAFQPHKDVRCLRKSFCSRESRTSESGYSRFRSSPPSLWTAVVAWSKEPIISVVVRPGPPVRSPRASEEICQEEQATGDGRRGGSEGGRNYTL
ncbi:hypothetical protein BaRGS_00002439 [Batillaria attramentaria]|uniref:Uncharacterized protein n=1 Tax=Batillaria attramentaria TaxID=370345 RepID=A0ABD0M3Q1_9CAEN